ncbi:MAG: ribulose-phosphate 3-epimerase [Spirochaetaceae bacterium]|jgi:ribulose-phosphate 3-epimerase|nr:ribulose-phosphate 3-epimerase [Spirochaetaceae bacterium]
MRRPLVAPSILSADFANLGQAVDDIAASGADWIHVDVMDGNFVPPITFGAKMVEDLRGRAALPFDVHLMTRAPENLVPAFAAAGADYITFHLEAAVHAHRVLQNIRGLGKKAGVSIVPSTPAGALSCLLPFVDLVLVMTVNPGYGGQTCITECFSKIEYLARLRTEQKLDFLLSVDGGINESTARGAAAAGADVLVTGSAFFGAADRAAFVERLRG